MRVLYTAFDEFGTHWKYQPGADGRLGKPKTAYPVQLQNIWTKGLVFSGRKTQ